MTNAYSKSKETRETEHRYSLEGKCRPTYNQCTIAGHGTK